MTPRVETGPKRVRAVVAGQVVADSRRPRLVWEHDRFPAYHLPEDDVRVELLADNGRRAATGTGLDARGFDLRVGDRHVADAGWRFGPGADPALRGLVRLRWDAVDHWLEEDEEVFVHPRDPYTRIDVLHSSRHVQVRVGDTVVADSHRPTLLFETHLPTRYYLPVPDVRMDLLVPSASRTRCPYKGTADYWSVRVGDRVHEDLVWTYRTALPEAGKVAGLLCFFNERTEITVDGEPAR